MFSRDDDPGRMDAFAGRGAWHAALASIGERELAALDFLSAAKHILLVDVRGGSGRSVGDVVHRILAPIL
jgi:hypothetical protein